MIELPVYLIGYMGAGKTTVGRLLADKLGWTFVDLDDAFREIHGYSTADYIRQFGMEAFRRKEKYVVEDLAELPYEHVIYATGGGYPCWEDNMECLRELGTSIYLRWQPEHLVQRLLLTDLDQRPVLQGHTDTTEELSAFVTQQLHARAPYYEQANFIVDAPVENGISPEDDEHLAQILYHKLQTLLRH